MKNINDVVKFSSADTEAKKEIVDNPGLLSAPYKAYTWSHYKDEAGGCESGVWEAEAFREAFVSEHTEFCYILSGTVRLTDESGISSDFGANESFVIPVGFTGVWENIGTVKKLYAFWSPS